MEEATHISEDWMDSKLATRTLGISMRTLQKRAQDGHLRYKIVTAGRNRFRLYNAVDVRKLKASGTPRGPKMARRSRLKKHRRLSTRLRVERRARK